MPSRTLKFEVEIELNEATRRKAIETAMTRQKAVAVSTRDEGRRYRWPQIVRLAKIKARDRGTHSCHTSHLFSHQSVTTGSLRSSVDVNTLNSKLEVQSNAESQDLLWSWKCDTEGAKLPNANRKGSIVEQSKTSDNDDR